MLDSQSPINPLAARQGLVAKRERSVKESRRVAKFHATADWWLEGMLRAASGTQQSRDDLWRILYPVIGKRGPRRAPRATRLYVAWRVRILSGRGFSAAGALEVILARFGPGGYLSDSDRAQAEFDDLVKRIEAQCGWQVPRGLDLPRSAGVPQANTARRKTRQRAQQAAQTRLAWLQAKITKERDEGKSDDLDLSDWEALMRAALGDGQMRRSAEAGLPTELRAKRPRGRPPKRPAKTDAPEDHARDPVALMPHEWTASEREIIEAVLRYLLDHGTADAIKDDAIETGEPLLCPDDRLHTSDRLPGR